MCLPNLCNLVIDSFKWYTPYISIFTIQLRHPFCNMQESKFGYLGLSFDAYQLSNVDKER